MFKKILVPVDLSEEGLMMQAVDVAREFADASRGDLRFVNVQPNMMGAFADFEAQIRRVIRHDLENAAARTGCSPERLSTAVRFGSVYHEVLAEADEWGSDLIIVGSHRPTMAAYLIGSNAKTIVRHAKCSVLVVRQ
jgi:universal stress protein F